MTDESLPDTPIPTIDDVKVRLRPLGNYIVVLQMEAEEVRRGGIVIPASDKAPYQGTVVAVGPGPRTNNLGISADQPMATAVGDHIVFGQFSGAPMAIDGLQFLALAETDVIAVLAPKKTEEEPDAEVS